MILVQESRKRHDTRDIRAETIQGKRIGLLAATVAAWLAPLIDQGILRFKGHLPENSPAGWESSTDFCRIVLTIILRSSGKWLLQKALDQPYGDLPHEMVCRAYGKAKQTPDVDKILHAIERFRSLEQQDLLPETRLLLALLSGIGRESQVNFAPATATRREAIRRVGLATNNTFSIRRTRDVMFVIRYLLDCPDRHQGNLVGLAEKSIRWHRTHRRVDLQQLLDKYGAERAVARPPISLPTDPSIRFLENVGDFCEESELMGHCIATYIPKAVRGSSFFFHISRDGEEATVQVHSSTGKVIQAAGPRNVQNAAADWGQRALNRWGRDIRAAREVSRRLARSMTLDEEAV